VVKSIFPWHKKGVPIVGNHRALLSELPNNVPSQQSMERREGTEIWRYPLVNYGKSTFLIGK
jgi:hypothetical protein